ncbi:hypothetical protein [Methylocystis hirsuta]|uniref:Uncharacterized protein n=1 Tax=Methylocystis hirsuta TaxID=369798 RepID=A0A3M9XM44_9HYPH|nr:hypothetical protein [Methylocystis hirsuta]RNJ49349.1 hypothetical protein D1O30_06810 [Methylocystis hirsuta]
MTTAIGPQGPNYTTSRPATSPVASGGIDTWAKDCTAAGAKDGTFLNASFFNIIVAQLRETIRQAGVALDDLDDLMLYKAIQNIADERIAAILGSRLSANRGVRIIPGVAPGYLVIQSNLGLSERPVLT